MERQKSLDFRMDNFSFPLFSWLYLPIYLPPYLLPLSILYLLFQLL